MRKRIVSLAFGGKTSEEILEIYPQLTYADLARIFMRAANQLEKGAFE
jgi:uncharacterized protein (DUF433 family)